MDIKDIARLYDLGQDAILNAQEFLMKEGYEAACDNIWGTLILRINDLERSFEQNVYPISFDKLYFTFSSVFDFDTQTLIDAKSVITCRYSIREDLLRHMCEAMGIVSNQKEFEEYCCRIDYEDPKPSDLDRKIYDDYKMAVKIANCLKFEK